MGRLFERLRQKIKEGFQVEEPDHWLRDGNPWEVSRPEYEQTIHFGGRTEHFRDPQGIHRVRWIETNDVIAIPYDMPISGYCNETINTLRLWKATATNAFNLDEFNAGSYSDAVEAKNDAEHISMVLYPNDSSENGKELRLRQQYFLASASIKDVMRLWEETDGSDYSTFADFNVFQMNDTHPTIAVAELMRILLDEKHKQLRGLVKQATDSDFFCVADAQSAAEKLQVQAHGSYHKISTEIVEVPKFGRGRPAKDRPRTPVGYRYQLQARIEQDSKAIEPLNLQAGCFVLLCNVPQTLNGEYWDEAALLSLYKEQYGIEKNFGFLKDPVIVNSIFLKKPQRIEVLGLVLLIALLIWRLMERTMRQYLEEKNITITGWDNRQTKRPTSFMMTTKFINTLVLTVEKQRKLARPFKAEQVEFLAALNVTTDIFTVP